MGLPNDPVMLMSMINMKLRDGDYENLTDLCQSLGIEEDALMKKLEAAGFDYLPEVKQFR